MTSQRKRIANFENAQQSTGPTSARGKAHSSFNAAKRGLFPNRLLGERQAKKLRKQDGDLRAELQPTGATLERYYRRLCWIEWSLRLVEGAIRSTIEQAAFERSLDSCNGIASDADLVALIPAVRQALARIKAKREEAGEAPEVSKLEPEQAIERAHIDWAVAEGIGPSGQAGRLSQLFNELRLLERDYDRTLKMYLALKATQAPIDETPRLAS